MGQKVHPTILRTGIIFDWKSKWFNRKRMKEFLAEDTKIRDFIYGKLSKAGLAKIEIERAANAVKIIIYTSRPGLIIGRGGTGVEQLRLDLQRIVAKQRPKEKIELRLEIEEIRQSDVSAPIVAQGIAEQIEKRMLYRRVMKQTLEKIMQNKSVEGAKVMLKGRLDGSEIARREWLAKGRIPLQTLRANIDFGQATAFTTYGTVGIKVWIYKGEIF
jgi:small subunit ribosomal protein S3